MHDRDEDHPDFRRGPGAHKSPRGAVIEAYVESEALDRVCKPPPVGCGAVLGEFCKFPDGSERHHPCVCRCSGPKTGPESVSAASEARSPVSPGTTPPPGPGGA